MAEITGYSWEVNDVEVSTDQVYSPTFTDPGIYKIKLTVTDDALIKFTLQHLLIQEFTK